NVLRYRATIGRGFFSSLFATPFLYLLLRITQARQFHARAAETLLARLRFTFTIALALLGAIYVPSYAQSITSSMAVAITATPAIYSSKSITYAPFIIFNCVEHHSCFASDIRPFLY